MKMHISQTPAREAAVYIEEKLLEHSQEPTLLLLSGGSSLSIIQTITKQNLSEKVTVALVDERFTQDIQGNNFLQLQETDFYTTAQRMNVAFIDSVPKTGERHEQFAERLKMEFENYFESHPNGYTLGVFGIGEDGHTAGIFPSLESEFKNTYVTDALYVAITQPQQTYPFRTTITPSFIEEKINDVILYAVGENKCNNILNYMHNKNFASFQIPALIPAQHPQSILFTDCLNLL